LIWRVCSVLQYKIWLSDETLKIVQTLYEQKVVTYPRVDTIFYQTMSIQSVWHTRKVNQLCWQKTALKKKIKKSTKVFNDKKSNWSPRHYNGIQSNLQYNQATGLWYYYKALYCRVLWRLFSSEYHGNRGKRLMSPLQNQRKEKAGASFWEPKRKRKRNRYIAKLC
jgi:hypothetical protein